MERDGAPQDEAVLETPRLRLRRWIISDAAFHRRLWSERDPRVPARRRLSPDGHPTLAELEDAIRRGTGDPPPGLLVAERRQDGTPIGYCGLVPSSLGRTDEPELAYEFLQEVWQHGYATETARAILDHAAESGYRHLTATVRSWNSASFRVLEKLGFSDTGERELDPVHGDSLLWRVSLGAS